MCMVNLNLFVVITNCLNIVGCLQVVKVVEQKTKSAEIFNVHAQLVLFW